MTGAGMKLVAAARTVLVCDTQPVSIEGVRGVLAATDDLKFAGAVSTLEAALELSLSLAPAVVIVDKALGTAAITTWLTRLNAEPTPTAAVVWGAGVNEAEALRLLQAGARGVLRRSADSETLRTCLRLVSDGHTWLDDAIFGENDHTVPERRSQLTPRENEVARLVEKGLRNREIALDLGIQTGTVKIHLKHIFEKTGVRGRWGLALNGLKERGAITIMQ
jgi:DNA-binding NarL/FixJ family response regulator